LSIEVVSLECMKEFVEEDENFVEFFKACKEPLSIYRTPYFYFHIKEGFLFKNQILCLPWSSLCLNLVKKLHSGGLGRNFGVEKTTMLVKEK